MTRTRARQVRFHLRMVHTTRDDKNVVSTSTKEL